MGRRGFEGCNCELLCPCHVSFRQRGSYDACEAIWAAHIDRGQYGSVDVGGLNTLVVALAPGPTMADGNWAALLYVDDTSTTEQERAVIGIFSGEAGGGWARIAQFYTGGVYRAIKRASLQYVREGRTRSLRMGDAASLNVEAIRGADPDEEVRLANLRNVIHGQEHILARSTHRVSDEGLQWDNSGKHGLYSAFRWSGP